VIGLTGQRLHQTRAPPLTRALNWCAKDRFFTVMLLVS
jgi:hypothetical protein